jgi:hypothetical protein
VDPDPGGPKTCGSGTLHLTAPEKLGVPVYEDVSAVVLLTGDTARQHGREESILDIGKRNRIYMSRQHNITDQSIKCVILPVNINPLPLPTNLPSNNCVVE